MQFLVEKNEIGVVPIGDYTFLPIQAEDAGRIRARHLNGRQVHIQHGNGVSRSSIHR
jgi:hypothetical protein